MSDRDDVAALQQKSRGLRLRIFLLVAVPLLLPLIQLTVLIPLRQAGELRDSTLANARMVGGIYATNLSAALSFEDYKGVALLLESARAIPDLSYMAVTDATGARVGTVGDEVPDAELRPETVEETSFQNDTHLFVVMPVHAGDQRVGVLHARFSREHSAAEVRGFVWRGLATGVVVLLIAGAMAWFLGRGFAALFDQLRLSIRRSAERLDEAVRQLAEVSAEQTSAASEEAAALQESSAVASQVGSSATTAATRASALIDGGARAEQGAQEGLSTVEAASGTMREVRQQMAAIATGIGALSKRAAAINDIANTVALLAERTNLLAVNAAIEAARSGQHGKGFGVVAQEMRALADGSNRSAAQVKQIVAEIQEAIARAVEDVREGERRAERGAESTVKAGDTISRFADATREFAAVGKEIASMSAQQNQAIEQLVESITHASEAGTQQLRTTHKVENTARELKALSAELLQTLSGSATTQANGAVSSTPQ